MERTETPWNPDTPIEGVFTNGTDCCQFTSEGGNPINDAAYLQILINIFHQSGVMDNTLKDWAMKPTQNQTLDNDRPLHKSQRISKRKQGISKEYHGRQPSNNYAGTRTHNGWIPQMLDAWNMHPR
jgi:hypothetical protein